MCGDGSGQSPQQWFGAATAKRAAAKEAGAAGLIEIYNSPQLPWKILVQYLNKDKVQLDKGESDDNFPAFWLNDDNRSAMKAFEEVSKASVSVEGADKKSFTAPNVFGYVEGSDPNLKDEFVVFCAHFDHVGIGTPDAKGDSIYNGTRDNGIGTVAVLQAAKNIAKNPTKRSALFVLFTAEEKGLLGSEYFVDNSPLPVKQMVYCNNVDNGGYNDTSKVTIIGLSRTTAKDNIVKASSEFGLEAIDDPAPEQGLFDRSDNVQFAKKGVPAPDFSLGFTAFDQEIMTYYHQPADHVESLDMAYIHKYWSAYVLTGRLIGNDPKKPFWVEGDKYYEAGVKLYE
jgi:aminopeptidase YwaD